jgi:hypothetical protein
MKTFHNVMEKKCDNCHKSHDWIRWNETIRNASGGGQIMNICKPCFDAYCIGGYAAMKRKA